MEILSIIASVISIVLGIYAIVQAERYNVYGKPSVLL